MYSTITQEMPVGFDVSATEYSSARASVARLLDNFVFSSLLILLVLVAVPYGTVEAWWVAAYESVVFALAAIWIIEGWLTDNWSIGKSSLILPLIALVVFAFIQTASWGSTGGGLDVWRAISADPFETRAFAWKLLALIVNGILLRRFTSNQRRLRLLIYVVIGIGVASAFFGIVRQAMQVDGRGFLLPYLRADSGYAQFINKNHFALFMEMALGLTCGMIVGGSVRRERYFYYGAAAFVMWVALVLTISRGGIFTMLIQILFLFTIYRFARTPVHHPIEKESAPRAALHSVKTSVVTRVVTMAVLLIVVGVGIVWVGGDVLVTRMKSLSGEVNTQNAEAHSGVSRRDVWNATLLLSKAHPIVGSGFGGYGVAITRYHAASGKWTPEAAHNDYLELLASGGLIAIALAAWFCITFVKSARQSLRSIDPFRRAACMGALVGLFGVAVHSIVDFGLHVTANLLIFTVLIVISTTGDGVVRKPADNWHESAEGAPN